MSSPANPPTNSWDGKTIIGRGGNSFTGQGGFIVDAAGNKTYGGDNGGVRTYDTDGNVYSGGDKFGTLDANGNIRTDYTTDVKPIDSSKYVTAAPTASSVASTPGASAGTAAAANWNVDDNQLVEKRLVGLINEENPLMKQSATDAKRMANKSGLLNSSMAITAGQDAIYRQAVPIATVDANTHASSAKSNADNQTQVSVSNAANQTQASISNANNAAESARQNASLSTQASITAANNAAELARSRMSADASILMQNAKADNDEAFKRLDQVHQKELLDIQNSNAAVLQASTLANAAFSTYANAVAQISQNPEYTADSKDNMIATQAHVALNQIELTSNALGVDLSGIIDALTPQPE
jgi:hypothetical protein